MIFKKHPTLPSLILSISCFCFILILPSINNEMSREAFLINYLIIYLSALMTIHVGRWMKFAVAFSIILQLIGTFFHFPFVGSAALITNFILFTFIVIKLTMVISSKKEVNAVILLDAVSAYLLICICFFFFNLLIIRAVPAALIGPEGYVTELGDILYYTIVTYTTLGYGEITPSYHLSKSLAGFCAISGQVYLTLVLALIVGKFVANANSVK